MVSKLIPPISGQALSEIFRKSSRNDNLIGTNEGINVEYKESFGWKSFSMYYKAMAAFANREGGYLIFGVKDRPHILLGLSQQSLERFENIDNQVLSTNLRDRFSPEIKWVKGTYVFDDKTYGVIYTYPATEKPVICKKNDDEIKKGAIYYRYNSQNSEIDYPELKAIIDAEKEKINARWMKTIRQIGELGIAHTALLDLNKGEIITPNSNLYMDESLLEQIKFVEEGTFVETGGDPALTVVGRIQTVVGAQPIVVEQEKNRAINADEIIKSFIVQEKVNNPWEFVKQICYQAAAYMPVYYYLRLANISNKDAIAYIDEIPINSATKTLLKRRIQNSETRYSPLPSNLSQNSSKKRDYAATIENQLIIIPSDETEIRCCLSAIRGLSIDSIKKSQSVILNVMHRIYTNFFNDPQYTKIKSDFRYALCWIDEALYMDEPASKN